MSHVMYVCLDKTFCALVFSKLQSSSDSKYGSVSSKFTPAVVAVYSPVCGNSLDAVIAVEWLNPLSHLM